MDRVELRILYQDGNSSKLRCIVNKWKFQDAMMGEQYLTFTITSETPIDWAVGDFCVFRGETYTLNYVPSVTQKAGTKERQDAYTYENVKFESHQEELTRCIMLDITASTGLYIAALGTNYTGSSKFPLYCGETSVGGDTLTPVCALAAKMQANLDRMYGGANAWKIFVDTTTTFVNAVGDTVLVTHTDDKQLSFDNTTVAQALAEVHNTFDLDYCIRGRNIYIGYNLKNLTSDNDEETFAFGYGKGYPTHDDMNKGLFQIKRMANPQQKIVTRLRALGSTKNMPYRYYNKKYNLSQSLFPTNLQLPDTFETSATKATHNAQRDPSLSHVKGDTNDSYIDKNNNAAACAEGIREDCARWDGSNGDLVEIYPTIEGATYGELRGALVEDQDGNTGNGSFPNYSADERIDKLLAVGYKDGSTLVDDANKGDGILPESGISSTGVVRSADIGQTSLTYGRHNQFAYNGGYYAGKDHTLFTIQGVMPGKYAMAPTIGSTFFGFSLSCYRDGCSADVGFQIIIKQKNQQTGVVTTLATYTSDLESIERSDGVKEIELPELPDVVNGANAKVNEIRVTAMSDITVTFRMIMRNVVMPSGFTDDFSISYKVGNSRLDHSVTYEPEYTWFPVDDSDSIVDRFHVFIQDMGFDLEACWSDETPMLVMKSGRCVGREFEILQDIKKVTHNNKKGYMLTLKRAEDSSLNTYYPSHTDPIAADDTFVLLGIQMPEAYVKMAEVRLLRAATQYLADNCETKFTYQPSIDDIYLQRNYDNMVQAGTPNKSIFWRLYAGLKFTFRGVPTSEDSPAPLADITIEKVTISMGEGLTPKVELTLNDDVQQGTIQKLTTSVDRIYNGSIFASGSGNGASGAMSAALLSLLQSEGEKLFLSKTHDDTAAGKITFNDVVTHNETLKAKKGVKVGNFQSRFLGSGALIDEEGNAEFESIYSRNFISTPEFRFNRIYVTEGEQWCTNGYGTIQEVEIIDETTGYITLKLEENDFASLETGDICRGIYNDVANQYETKTLDDDSELYNDDNDKKEEEEEVEAEQPSNSENSFGFSCKEGFFTSYFYILDMGAQDPNCYNRKGACKFKYELRNAKTPHPCEFMKFAQYGSFTNAKRRSSSYATSIGHYYEMVLDGVNTWKIQSANVVYRKGYLGNMTVTTKVKDKNGNYVRDEHGDIVTKEAELQGYGLYVQDNVYFGNAIVQLDPQTLADLEEQLKSYEVNFSGYVDVITVDDVGNCIGGLWTVSGENNEYINYRIHSAITVRKNGQLLTLASANADAGVGTFKIYADPKGCTCIVEDSTIYITGINNIKDGVAGSHDDGNFDYDAMRNMDSCSVDIIINCEGKGSIQKNFPVRIKHDSQPFVGADISNEMSAVSWNTQNQNYVGLPITFDMKMWHNNEILDIASTDNVSLVSVTTGVTLVNGSAPATPAAMSIYYTKEIITVSGKKHARITLTAMGKDIPTVVDIDVTSTATYSGVSYERTLRHTINKSTDTNVYSLLPSEDEVIYNKNRNSLSANTVDCGVICDSSDNKHYNVAFADFATHKIVMYYKKFYTDGTNDSNETLYNNSAINIDSSVKEVRFYLYGLTNGSVDRTILHDTEGVPVLADGQDGKGVEYIFYAVSDWDREDAHMPTIYDVAADRQVDDYCPYTDAQHSGQWTDEPTGVSANLKYEFYAQRKKVNGVWQPFSGVKVWDHFPADGESPYMIDLSNEQSFVNCDDGGNVLSGATYETSRLMLFKGGSYAFTDFNILITPTNISCNGNTNSFYLTDSQKSTAQSNGYFTLTPSAITSNTAQISVQAQLKTNTSIVLTTAYKINKNIAGSIGSDAVVFSLQPSLNVVHKDGAGNFIDTTLDVEVKKIVGTSTETINTGNGLSDNNISLKYTRGSDTTKNDLAVSGNSTATLFGSSTYITLFIVDGNNVVLDRERINVVCDGEDGEDASEVNPNILLRTIFDYGIDFVKEQWISNYTYVFIDSASDTPVEGRKCIRINATNASSDIDFQQNVLGRVKTGTWYTLSFNYFATAYSHSYWQTFIWAGTDASGKHIIDDSAGYYLDGVFHSSIPVNGRVDWPCNWQGGRHSVTFKTRSTFPSGSEVRILFRCPKGEQLAICMPKLEIGQVATAYIAHEGDLPGTHYYLTSDINSIIRTYTGSYRGSATPCVTAWKKVSGKDPQRLCDITDVNGVIAEGFTLNVYEMNGSSVEYINTSSSGICTCKSPYTYVDRFEAELVKGGKTYATLPILIVTEQQGQAGADGVFPRDCGMFDPNIATNQKFGYAGYIYRKVGDVVIRDMVRYEIGGVLYAFMVKTKSQSSLVTTAPSYANGDTYWEAAGIVETVIANTIFGANANIGGFMASAEMLRSSTPAYRVKYLGDFKALSYGLYYQGTFQLGTNYYYAYHGYSVYGAVYYNGTYYKRVGSSAPDTTKYPNQDTSHWTTFASADYACISHPNEEFLIPEGCSYTYQAASGELPAIRPMVKYNSKYYVAKGSQLGKTFCSQSLSSTYWREAYDFEIGGIQNVNDTVDVPKFTLSGGTGTLIMRQADDTIYTYDEDGKQTTGYEDGRKVVIDPATKSVSVFNDSGNQVITINGETKSSIASAYTGDSGSTSAASGNVNKGASSSGCLVKANEIKVLSNTFTIGEGGWNLQIQASLSVQATFAGSTVWCADQDKGVLSYIQPITYSGGSYGHQSYCKAELILVKEGGSTVVIASGTQGVNGGVNQISVDKNIHVSGGTYYFALRYTYALYSNHSLYITHGALSAAWAKDGYMGEIFANGLAFGNNAQNFFAVIKESNTNLHLKLLSNNKYGLEISSTGVKVCINGTWYTVGVSGGQATLT